MAQWWKDARPKTKVKWLVGAVVLLLAAFAFGFGVGCGKIELHCPISFTAEGDRPRSAGQSGGRAPHEFLLLDTNRVDSYLAQMTNGDTAIKHLSQRLTKSAGAGFELSGAKLEAKTQQESFVEREVTPTAASRLIELEAKLDKQGLVKKEKLLHEFRKGPADEHDVEAEVESLEDGDMVRFKATLRGPAYLDPYLTVTHAATVPALFPKAIRIPTGRALVEARREAAKKFRKQIGKDPRAILGFQPRQEIGRRNISVLMPLHMKQLSEERSLLRTGGTFTILGKIVRIFSPEPVARESRKRTYSYIDTPTLQTWLHPIRRATGELICRANLTCATRVEVSKGATGRSRRNAIDRARRTMIRALRKGTRIGRDGGALVIPVAIYR